jgi:tetratricopeptide (TPR) repeat protein
VVITRRQFMQAVAAAAVLSGSGTSHTAWAVNRANMWPHDSSSADTLARCNRLLATDPDDVLALCHRGQVSAFVRAEALGEADLSKAICLEPNNPALYYIRGVTLNRAADLRYAIGLLSVGGDSTGKAICGSTPDYYCWHGNDQNELLFIAYLAIGSVLEEEGRKAEALIAFERAASFRVISQADLERWCESDMQVGRWCEAVIGYRRLIEIEPKAEYRRRLDECRRRLRVPPRRQ